MIKSIFAVAVVGAFSATAFAAMPSVDNGSGAADVTKINNNFTTLDNSKLDKSTYANNALLVNSKLAEKVVPPIIFPNSTIAQPTGVL